MRMTKPLSAALALLPLMALGTPKNIVVMVPDGTGLASLTVARQLKGAPLALDRAIYGTVQTRSADSSVTDSAAAATAMSCGRRTRNGAIAVDADKVPMVTFGAWAKAQGKAVGIVTTDTIVGATPAAFSAHAETRRDAEALIEGQIGSGFDLFLGGGAALLTPERRDALRARGYALPSDVSSLRAVRGKVFGLFAPGPMTAMVERREGPCAEPTLSEMAAKALELLSEDPDGLFLLIEGAQVDHGHHEADLPWAVHELLAFDDAVAEVLAWAKTHPDTVVLIAPDHETGGLSLLPEPREGARAEALGRATAKAAGTPKDYFVHYATDWHTGVDVFLAGNRPDVRPALNQDFPKALADRAPEYLHPLEGRTETVGGVTTLLTPEGRRLRAHRDAVYLPSTGKWYAM